MPCSGVLVHGTVPSRCVGDDDPEFLADGGRILTRSVAPWTRFQHLDTATRRH